MQFTMMFKGREMMHVDLGLAMMNKIVESLEDVSKVEHPASVLGKRMTVIMVPK